MFSKLTLSWVTLTVVVGIERVLNVSLNAIASLESWLLHNGDTLYVYDICH